MSIRIFVLFSHYTPIFQFIFMHFVQTKLFCRLVIRRIPLFPHLLVICSPVFRRSTRKVPTFSSVYFFHLFHCPSIFPIFTANFQCPFGAFFIEKNFLICYNQALLLDADLVPVAMQMYPGNESEKPYIRKIIEEMEIRYKISGKTVQVADKGLNCARNIYAAVKEADDGYIFSKSIHGKNLSEEEKKWIVLENDKNVWVNYRDCLLYTSPSPRDCS